MHDTRTMQTFDEIDGFVCKLCGGRGYRHIPFREWIDEDTPTLSAIVVKCKCNDSNMRQRR